ncbi:MAG: class I SAM-dependent methyltransferase family protein [Candidatus Thorarchaeota archaeon]
MSAERPYLKVPDKQGETYRRGLIEVDLLDCEHRIIADEGFLFFPLSTDINEDDLQEILQRPIFEMGRRMFEYVITGPKTLAEAFKGDLKDTELELLPRAYDLIGDIAVLEIPKELAEHEVRIGSKFLEIHSNFSTVLAKHGAISGTTRVREYKLLAGENRTHTIHTEYGCRIAVDLAKAYFSPRLLEEHHRIAKQVENNELVVDMFTGVGPFALHIAKRCKAKVTAIDINPEGIELLRKSIKLNKLVGSILPVVADAHQHVPKNYNRSVDRIIMNHPSGASDFVSDACHALRDGGVIHYYDFLGGSSPEEELTKLITKLVEQAGREVTEIHKTRRVRDSAPYEFQMVADAIIH